ncbi:MAG: DUF58 domain-containing protein [Betaproteobacteria bacterium]|nr:DUF58 domain-containing protein [Betaproteobacteria bacterium]
MLIPTPRLLRLAGALAAGGVVASFVPAAQEVWIAAALALAAAALVDALGARRIVAPGARRALPGSLALGVAHDVCIRLENRAGLPLRCELQDHFPHGIEARGLPQHLTVPAQGWAELRYSIRPVRRGPLRFGRIQARIASRLRLWQTDRLIGEEAETRVYPNFAALTGFALLAIDNRLSQIGVLQRRRRGEGLNFHQLREYRQGDSPRSVDWKASSRMGKLISREYQDERDQQLVLLLDCGRRMHAQDGELSHFDHVLNSALMLAYVGLRQGDAVGLLTMSGERRWLAPKKSMATVNLILNRVYDLAPTLHTTDYHGAALDLMGRLRKRALVVVLTNLRDEDDDALTPALRLLQTRHLVLFASLRESILARALAARADNFERALTHAAAADYLLRRELSFKRLARSGAVCLDVEPPELPIALVNRYIDIKRGGRL